MTSRLRAIALTDWGKQLEYFPPLGRLTKTCLVPFTVDSDSTSFSKEFLLQATSATVRSTALARLTHACPDL